MEKDLISWIQRLSEKRSELGGLNICPFAKKAMERNTGARGLRSILEGILLDIMYELPSQKTIEKVVIDSSCVAGGKPTLVHHNSSSVA